MATFSISFLIGAGVGALISGLLADRVGLRGMYLGSVVITLMGLTVLGCAWKSLPRPGESEALLTVLFWTTEYCRRYAKAVL